MEPIDKFGRTLYPHVFRRLQETGRKLTTLGYAERPKKPNLFSCRYSQVTFYADMRGTREVAIWEDTRPLFYWFFKAPPPDMEVRQRMVKIEWVRLGSVGLRLPTIIEDEDTWEESSLILGLREDEGEHG
jgi:hypothetical protein